MTESASSKPLIVKKGTISCGICRTTPVVFKERLYRSEWVDSEYTEDLNVSKCISCNYRANKTGESFFRFIDVESGKSTRHFAGGYALGCAHVEGDTVYVYAAENPMGSRFQVFRTTDLKNWSSRVALEIPGWTIGASSVCKGDGKYVMSIEANQPRDIVGVPFTQFFAESDDLLNWRLLPPSEYSFSKDRYTAAPALRFLDSYYYLIYMEKKEDPYHYESHIVRSRDLIRWQSSPYGPVLQPSDQDRMIANPKLNVTQRDCIAKTPNRNNGDVGFCQWQGKTIIYYSWGTQNYTDFLAHAIYEGTLSSFLKGYFPE